MDVLPVIVILETSLPPTLALQSHEDGKRAFAYWNRIDLFYHHMTMGAIFN